MITFDTGAVHPTAEARVGRWIINSTDVETAYVEVVATQACRQTRQCQL